jgi:hypothetical protein
MGSSKTLDVYFLAVFPKPLALLLLFAPAPNLLPRLYAGTYLFIFSFSAAISTPLPGFVGPLRSISMA